MAPEKERCADMGKELEILREHLARHGMNLTRQRVAVVNAFLKTDGHVTAEEIYQQLRDEGSRVGLATVYRTLSLLTDCNLAIPRSFGDGTVRYEKAYGYESHDHMICDSCGSIVEFHSDCVDQLKCELLTQHNFVVDRHRLVLYGICGNCRE